MARLIIKNLDQLVQVCSNRELFKAGAQQDQISVIERKSDAVGVSLVVDKNGLISYAGLDDQAPVVEADRILDGRGCSLVPGLVDPHTHPVWAGDRLFEFELKARGATYLDVHAAGGGIYHTVEATRGATKAELKRLLHQRLRHSLSCGSTLQECKSGYGLDLDTELKQLEAIAEVDREQPVDLVSTYLGAHAVPRDMSPEEGVVAQKNIMKRMAPVLKERKIPVDFVDVFCEKGVYNIEQSKEILAAGREILGCDIGFHGDELCQLGAAEMAAEINAKSCSHLEYCSEQGIISLAKSKTAAIICPTTAYILRLKSPPVRDMISKGVIVAFASDFNPNAYCYSMPLAMNLAVVNQRVTLNEALVGSTINAAYALNRSKTHGSLETGKIADCVLINDSDWRRIIYQIGEVKDLIKAVIKNGNIVIEK